MRALCGAGRDQPKSVMGQIKGLTLRSQRNWTPPPTPISTDGIGNT